MFEVSVEHSFAAGHALRHYKGKCENVHGHNYKIQVTIAGDKLNSIGLLVDFVDLKRILRAASERLDHQFINDIEPFTELNPSAENMAKYFYDEMSKGIAATTPEVPVVVSKVKVWETDITTATYTP
jgi:6-pyruvoyltetrahydropterin/6-carboxytetrahydropterin synthase